MANHFLLLRMIRCYKVSAWPLAHMKIFPPENDEINTKENTSSRNLSIPLLHLL